MTPPTFIARAEIRSLPLDFQWKGTGEHIGPVERVTKLLNSLSGTTTCGQVTLCSGVLQWGAWRLQGHTPVEHGFELAESAFAWQVDHRYVDEDQGPLGATPDEPPALSAMMELSEFMQQALNAKRWWNRYYQPISETFHSVHVVRHILPKTKRKLFDQWLNATVKRVKSVAPKPDEDFKPKDEFDSPEEHKEFIARHRGDPLPPQILDPDFDYDDDRRVELIDQFLQSLDWGANRYLRSPDEMKEIGFEGTPYRLCP